MRDLTPEQRKERAIKAVNSRKVYKGKPKGAPTGWTEKEFLRAQHQARIDAKRIIDIMATEGLLPQDDMAKEALLEAYMMMKTPNAVRDKLSIIRTILEYTKSKPASTQNVNIKTAEDFLQELADEDTPDTNGPEA